ncbi:MAG TPA: hypothetical protein VG675_22265 [Bryobacteraceae bacterium]|nr:hypothetical protein [Bryobacteraceae bacterium]
MNGALPVLLLLAAPAWHLYGETKVISVFPIGTTTPINFETESSNVITTASGYMVFGEADLITPLGKIPLLNANLSFSYAPGTTQVQTMHGEAYVPSPFVSANASIEKPVLAEMGIDFGKNLKLGVPLLDDRIYTYFKFDAGLKMDVGSTSDAGDEKASPWAWQPAFPLWKSLTRRIRSITSPVVWSRRRRVRVASQ